MQNAIQLNFGMRVQVPDFTKRELTTRGYSAQEIATIEKIAEE